MAGELVHVDGRAAGPPAIRPESGSVVIRGGNLADPEDVDKWADWVQESDPYHINILSKVIPHKYAFGHLLFTGMPDSGKTTCINQVLRDMLWHVGRGYGHRVFIWDYKRTARSYLESLQLEAPVYYLDPIDKRTVGIDWPRQLDTPLAAVQFSRAVLSPEADPKGHNYGFVSNARATLARVICTFQARAAGRWDLTDVIEACTSPKRLQRVLSRTQRGRDLLGTVFGARNQGMGVYFSLYQLASDLEPIANALSKVPPERRITLRDWLKGESVLVLGHYEDYSEALAPFQSWVFGALSRALLSGPDIAHDGSQRTAFFLDEVRNSPFGPYLHKLANSGRSKGAALVAGLADFSGVYDLLGEKKAEEFVGMFKTKVFLRMDGKAAEWAGKYFSRHLRMVRKFSEGANVAYALSMTQSSQTGRGGGHLHFSDGNAFTEQESRGKQVTYAYEPVERPVVYERELAGLIPPKVEEGRGLVVRAFMVVQEHGWYEQACFMERYTIAPKEDVAEEPFENDAFENETGWGKEDYERFGLEEAEEQEPAPKERASRGSLFERTFALTNRETAPEETSHEETSHGEHLGIWFDEGDGHGFVVKSV